MLTESQTIRVWEGMLAAETRSLYFGDLGTRYTRYKQWITGVSFFLASGATATLIAKSPAWIPVVLSLVVAILNAYSIAVSLDRRISVMAELRGIWSEIANDYDRLWNHANDDGAEGALESILGKERAPSDLAVREAPWNSSLLAEWQRRVFALHHVETAAE